MAEQIDPVENREEFQKRLKRINCAVKVFPQEQILLALVNDDTGFLQQVKDANTACQTKINNYLDAWDNAEDEAGRRQVVGSVTAFTLEEVQE